MAVKPDLKRSLLFLARDRAKASQRVYVHQPVALMEQNRRKAADKRFSGIIAARHKMNAIQVAVDKLEKCQVKPANGNRKLPSYNEPALKIASPIPGFRYHYNGDEKQTTKRVVGAEKLSWLGSHLVDNKTHEKWKKTTAQVPRGYDAIHSAATPLELRSQVDSTPPRGAKKRYNKSPYMEENKRSSIIARQENRSSFMPRPPGVDCLKRYRKQVEKEGARMVSMVGNSNRGNNSFDVALFQDISQRKAEIMLKVLNGTGINDGVMKSELVGKRSRVPGQDFGRMSPHSYAPWRKPERDDVERAEMERSKELQARIDHFLQEVKNCVHHPDEH